MSDSQLPNSSTWMESLAFNWTPYMSRGTEVQVQKDETLFHEGHHASHVYAVLKGRVRLCQMSPTGEEKALVVIGANGLIGEIGALEGEGYVTSATCSANSTLLRLPVVDFRQLFNSDNQFAEYVCHNLSRKVTLVMQQVTALSYASAQYRIVRYLIELAQTYGEVHPAGIRIGVHFTHQEMANLAGTTRVTVAQVVRRLEERHLLMKEGEFFHIPSIESLVKVLDQPKASHFQNRQKFNSEQ